MKKTKLFISLMFISLLGFSQINNEKKDQDDHKKAGKIIDNLFKNNQLDSTTIYKAEEEQAMPEIEKIKEAPLAPPSPVPSKSNIKSEPVPGAEIIIDKEPATDKKKNKIKATNNQIAPKNSENDETNENKDKNR